MHGKKLTRQHADRRATQAHTQAPVVFNAEKMGAMLLAIATATAT